MRNPEGCLLYFIYPLLVKISIIGLRLFGIVFVEIPMNSRKGSRSVLKLSLRIEDETEDPPRNRRKALIHPLDLKEGGFETSELIYLSKHSTIGPSTVRMTSQSCGLL